MPQQVLLLGSQNKQVPRGAGLLDSVIRVKTSALCTWCWNGWPPAGL